MKIIDSHLHFCPGYPHFDEIAIEAGHINNEEHLRECFQKYNIVGGIVMGNRGVHPDNHTYPDFLRYCVGVEARKLTPEKIQKTCDLVEENLKRNTCVGIKLYPGYDSIYVTDERFEPIYDLAKAYKKPVAIHTGQTAGSKAFIKYSHPLTLDEAARPPSGCPVRHVPLRQPVADGCPPPLSRKMKMSPPTSRGF